MTVEEPTYSNGGLMPANNNQTSSMDLSDVNGAGARFRHPRSELHPDEQQHPNVAESSLSLNSHGSQTSIGIGGQQQQQQQQMQQMQQQQQQQQKGLYVPRHSNPGFFQV